MVKKYISFKKEIFDTNKCNNSKVGTTKDSTIIESILNNLYQFNSNNTKKLRKEVFLNKEKSRVKNIDKDIPKNLFVSTDCSFKNRTNYSNFITSFDAPRFGLNKEIINASNSNRVDNLLHQNNKSELNKRNGLASSSLKNSKSHEKISINQLQEKINVLEAEKKQLEHEIFNFRKIIKNHKKEDLNKKIETLENEKESHMNTANNYLNLCSQLAEDVIILRNQVDKFSHPNTNTQMNININDD